MTTPFSLLLPGAGALLNPELQPISGAFASTEAVDTCSSTGTVLVKGSLTVTAATDTIASTGKVTVQGTFSVTDAVDTISSTGKVVVQGTLSVTDAADTIAAAGKVTVQGTLASTDTADTFSFSGGVLVQGTLGFTETSDSPEFPGQVLVTGVLSVTDGDLDLLAGLGTVLVSGELSIVESWSDAFAADGTVTEGAPGVSGTFEATEPTDTVEASGTVKDTYAVTGDLNATERSGDSFLALGGRIRSPEEQVGGLWTFYAWSFWAQHFDGIREIALQQPTDNIHSGYYRTLFSVEAFNDSITALRNDLQRIGMSVSPKVVSAIAETSPPRERQEKNVPTPKAVTAELVSGAMRLMEDQARLEQRIYRMEKFEVAQEQVLAMEQARRSRLVAQEKQRVARRRRASAILLLAA